MKTPRYFDEVLHENFRLEGRGLPMPSDISTKL